MNFYNQRKLMLLAYLTVYSANACVNIAVPDEEHGTVSEDFMQTVCSDDNKQKHQTPTSCIYQNAADDPMEIINFYDRPCHLTYCSIRYDYDKVEEEEKAEHHFANHSHPLNLQFYGNYSHEFDNRGYCWNLHSECPGNTDAKWMPNINNAILCNFNDCNNVTLMNEIYSNTSGMVLAPSTLEQIQHQPCTASHTPNNTEWVCKLCERDKIVRAECEHTTPDIVFAEPAFPKEIKILIGLTIIGLSIVMVFGYFINRSWRKLLRHQPHDEEIALIVPVTPDFNITIDKNNLIENSNYPDGTYMTGTMPRLLVTKKRNDGQYGFKDKVESQFDCLIAAQSEADIPILCNWKKIRQMEEWYVTEDIFQEDKEPITLHELIEGKRQISIYCAVKMMQSIMEGFHGVTSNQIRTFINHSNKMGSTASPYELNPASVLQISPKNFVFDRNFLWGDEVDEMDRQCWFKFIIYASSHLSNKSEMKGNPVDIGEEIYRYEKLEGKTDGYAYLLYRIKLILGLVLQLVNAPNSSILLCHPYAKLLKHINKGSHDSVVR